MSRRLNFDHSDPEGVPLPGLAAMTDAGVGALVGAREEWVLGGSSALDRFEAQVLLNDQRLGVGRALDALVSPISKQLDRASGPVKEIRMHPRLFAALQALGELHAPEGSSPASDGRWVVTLFGIPVRAQEGRELFAVVLVQ